MHVAPIMIRMCVHYLDKGYLPITTSDNVGQHILIALRTIRNYNHWR